MDKQKEIMLIDNTLKLLRRGKYELSGEEAIVFHTCFQYLVGRLTELKKPDIIQSKPEDKAKPKKVKENVD